MIDCRKKDLRVFADKVNNLNVSINNINSFLNNMISLGYEKFTNRFLVKTINNIQINITYTNDQVIAVVGYDKSDNNIIIDNNTLEQIKQDIVNSNN